MRIPGGALLVLLLSVTSCSSERQEAQEDAAAAAEIEAIAERGTARTESVAFIPTDRAGAFELDGTEYPFLVVRCDLTGDSPDGMLLHGTGTAPDGRRIAIEVEWLQDGDRVSQRATAFFGSIVDGDHWTSRAMGRPDERWFADEIGSEALEGPLIRVSGNELTAEGAYRHERDGLTKTGRIHATCPE